MLLKLIKHYRVGKEKFVTKMPIVLLFWKNDIEGRKIVASHRDLILGSAVIYVFIEQSFQS